MAASQWIYNERFAFANPLSRFTTSRTTAFRLRKRRSVLEYRPNGEPSSSQGSTSTTHSTAIQFEQHEQLIQPPLFVEDDNTYFQAMDNEDVTSTYHDQRVYHNGVTERCDLETRLEDHLDCGNNDDTTETTEETTYSYLCYDLEEEYSTSTQDGVEEDEYSESEINEQSTVDSCVNVQSCTPSFPSLSSNVSNLLIMKYKMRHNITDVALDDLLKLLRFHSPVPNSISPSVYRFKRQFDIADLESSFHYFCSTCLEKLPGKDSMVCSYCKADIKMKGISSFIELSVPQQLLHILQS